MRRRLTRSTLREVGGFVCIHPRFSVCVFLCWRGSCFNLDAHDKAGMCMHARSGSLRKDLPIYGKHLRLISLGAFFQAPHSEKSSVF